MPRPRTVLYPSTLAILGVVVLQIAQLRMKVSQKLHRFSPALVFGHPDVDLQMPCSGLGLPQIHGFVSHLHLWGVLPTRNLLERMYNLLKERLLVFVCNTLGSGARNQHVCI